MRRLSSSLDVTHDIVIAAARVPVAVRRLHPDAGVPAYSTDGDAGADLTSVAEVTLAPGERALDLYSGVGLFAVPLAEAVGATGSVLAVEADAEATRSARAHLAAYPWAEAVAEPTEQVLERLVCAGADHCGRARDLLGRRVRAELQRAGVQAQQRDPVGQHVVHLARDARALGVADLLDAQFLLGLGMT